MSASNTNGRALEFIIVKYLSESLHNCQLSHRAKIDQERDKLKFDSLSPTMQEYYLLAATKIHKWLTSKIHNLKEDIQIDRLSDADARKGNPSDISISTSDNQVINISLKHNHKATKHQRPSALPQQVGIIKGSELDVKYRIEYAAICNTFYKTVMSINSNITKFSEIKEIAPNIINSKLYKPVCCHVKQFLSNYCTDTNITTFFKFIVGNTNFYKATVDTSGNVEIIEFLNVEIPTAFTIEQASESYLNLKFSNNWEFSMRLHNGSSRIHGCDKSGCSLKFDTKLINDILPKYQI